MATRSGSPVSHRKANSVSSHLIRLHRVGVASLADLNGPLLYAVISRKRGVETDKSHRTFQDHRLDPEARSYCRGQILDKNMPDAWKTNELDLAWLSLNLSILFSPHYKDMYMTSVCRSVAINGRTSHFDYLKRR